MYVLAFLVGMFVLRRILKYRDLQFPEKTFDSLVLSVFLGVLLGGRFGFVLFYEPAFFLAHPLQSFAVWNGGMSSHGGFIGVALALLIFCRRHSVPFLQLLDVLVVPIAIGLAFGRLGNLINGELYGTVTTLPWGMHFPHIEGLRHPTQIYAICKDVFIAAVCFTYLRRSWPNFVPARSSAFFLMMYAFLRFVVEVFRDQPYGYVFGLSWGQIYTLPIFILGLGVWLWTLGQSPSRSTVSGQTSSSS